MKKAIACMMIFVIAIATLCVTLSSIKSNSLERSEIFLEENLENTSIEKVAGVTTEVSRNDSLVVRWDELQYVNGYEVQLTKELSVMRFYTTTSKIVFQSFGDDSYQLQIRGYRELKNDEKVYGDFSEPIILSINGNK